MELHCIALYHYWLRRAGCISQDTYLLYMLFIFNILERNTARAPQPQTNQPFLWSTFLVVATTCLEYRMGLFFGPKVWVVGYKLQPYWTTGELGWRSDWELKVNVVEHTGNQHRVTGVRVGLVIDSGSVLAPGILLWPDSKANIIAQSIPPFCISFIDKNTNNAGIANAV